MSAQRATFRTWLGVAAGAGLCVVVGYAIGAQRLRGEVFRASTAAPGAREPQGLPSFAAAVERTSPGVVAVRAVVLAEATADGTDAAAVAAGEDPLTVRDGSGFVVNDKGLVVTARHLAVGARRLVVDVPEHGRFQGQLVGEDEVTDLAVLRLVDPPTDLRPLELGPSEDLRAGDWVAAVGNPYGFRQSVTVGVISYCGRYLQSDDMRVSSEFLQFSAAVNPGSSGCPVVDFAGRVVGLTTKGADAAQGLSFAIPSRTLKWALAAMDKSPDGRVHRGRLGISFQEPRRGAGNDSGCVVRGVIPGQAADEAGIEPGDVVLAVDGEPIADGGELHDRITRSMPGTCLRLRIERKGEILPEFEVTLREAARDRKETAEAR